MAEELKEVMISTIELFAQPPLPINILKSEDCPEQVIRLTRDTIQMIKTCRYQHVKYILYNNQNLKYKIITIIGTSVGV